MTQNISLEPTIKQILNKVIIPTKIYKNLIGSKFTIEIETTDPQSFISILYKTEAERDADFITLDDRVFWILPFNPYNERC